MIDYDDIPVVQNKDEYLKRYNRLSDKIFIDLLNNDSVYTKAEKIILSKVLAKFCLNFDISENINAIDLEKDITEELKKMGVNNENTNAS